MRYVLISSALFVLLACTIRIEIDSAIAGHLVPTPPITPKAPTPPTPGVAKCKTNLIAQHEVDGRLCPDQEVMIGAVRVTPSPRIVCAQVEVLCSTATELDDLLSHE